MKLPSCLSIVLVSLTLSAGAFGKNVPTMAQPGVEDPVRKETNLVASIRAAAGRDDDVNVDKALLSQSETRESTALASRTMAVCGWLRNDGEYGRAIKLAEKTIKRLVKMKETSNAERAERLYWEACLLAEILDRKPEAVLLMEEAARLSPNDRRIAATAKRWKRELPHRN